MLRPRLRGPAVGMGEMMERCGVTARALRYYEEKGLITPRRDRLNQRCYDGATRADAEYIISLRDLGLPIKDIERLLRARREDPVRERMLLAARLTPFRADLERRLRAVEAVLLDLERAQVQAA
jgi:DNA-binding transcriptional MerR regulator